MKGELIDNYTKLELAKYTTINKQLVRILKKQSKLNKQLKELDQQETTLYYNLRQIEHKAADRESRKCKHTDIRGPYECMRDDCSGHHYSCRDCGNEVSETSPEQFKKSGKRWIAWREKY